MADKKNVRQSVNRLKGNPNSQHSDFYASRRESEKSAPDAENQQPVQKVSSQPSGAKRDSYFKKRDYE